MHFVIAITATRFLGAVNIVCNQKQQFPDAESIQSAMELLLGDHDYSTFYFCCDNASVNRKMALSIIDRFAGRIEWAPYSAFLMPIDRLFTGEIKKRVNKRTFASIDDAIAATHRVINEIANSQLFANHHEDLKSAARACILRKGHHQGVNINPKFLP